MRFIFLFLFIPFLLFSQHNNYNKHQNWTLYKYYSYYLKKKPKDIIDFFFIKSDIDNKKIAITFDDGPHRNSELIINYLLEENVPATFFLVAEKINDSNILLYQDSLFELGMHTFSHLDYTELSKQEKENDISKCIQFFKKFNISSDYFRPAYGIIDSDIVEILKNNNLKGVLWSLDALDWNGYRKKKIINHVVENIDNGSVILFHDRIDILDLKEIIKEIKLKGFSIVSLRELINSNANLIEE